MGPVCQTLLPTGFSKWELGPCHTERSPINYLVGRYFETIHFVYWVLVSIGVSCLVIDNSNNYYNSVAQCWFLSLISIFINWQSSVRNSCPSSLFHLFIQWFGSISMRLWMFIVVCGLWPLLSLSISLNSYFKFFRLWPLGIPSGWLLGPLACLYSLSLLIF